MVGSIDTVFVGMECVGAPLSWVYGPVLPVAPERRHSEQRRSNGCKAAHALELAASGDSGQAFIYAVGREPWMKHLLALDPSEHDVYMSEIGKFIRDFQRTGSTASRL